jgi:hypothetical protein
MKQTLAFQQMVRERGQKLRLLPVDRLIDMTNEPAEHITLDRRSGTIATLCKACDGERVAVVLLGNLDTWLSCMKKVARDGFYKYRDGSVTDIPYDELYDYDPLFAD